MEPKMCWIPNPVTPMSTDDNETLHPFVHQEVLDSGMYACAAQIERTLPVLPQQAQTSQVEKQVLDMENVAYVTRVLREHEIREATQGPQDTPFTSPFTTPFGASAMTTMAAPQAVFTVQTVAQTVVPQDLLLTPETVQPAAVFVAPVVPAEPCTSPAPAVAAAPIPVPAPAAPAPASASAPLSTTPDVQEIPAPAPAPAQPAKRRALTDAEAMPPPPPPNREHRYSPRFNEIDLLPKLPNGQVDIANVSIETLAGINELNIRYALLERKFLQLHAKIWEDRKKNEAWKRKEAQALALARAHARAQATA